MVGEPWFYLLQQRVPHVQKRHEHQKSRQRGRSLHRHSWYEYHAKRSSSPSVRSKPQRSRKRPCQPIFPKRHHRLPRVGPSDNISGMDEDPLGHSHSSQGATQDTQMEEPAAWPSPSAALRDLQPYPESDHQDVLFVCSFLSDLRIPVAERAMRLYSTSFAEKFGSCFTRGFCTEIAFRCPFCNQS